MKGPKGCWSVPPSWERVRSYVAGGRDLKLLRAFCFWLCGEGGCLDTGEEVLLALGVPSRRCGVYLVALLHLESEIRMMESESLVGDMMRFCLSMYLDI